MIFYVSAAILTIVMLLVALAPALRAKPAAAAQDEHLYDLTLYKEQMRELDADIARGAVDAEQGEYARAEIGRRILAVEDAMRSSHRHAAWKGRGLAVALALFVPAAAALLYGGFGTPGMKAQPLLARIEEERARQAAAQTAQGVEISRLVKQAEDQLALTPDDGRGWAVLAPMYLRLGRPWDARNAYERAIDLLGETAERQSGLAQAHYMLASGSMNTAARAAVARALELDPTDSRARFFATLGFAESGRMNDAVKGWRELAADTTAAPEWRAGAANALRQFDTAVAAAPQADIAAPALDEETVREGQAMDAEDRQAMIASMVERLDAKLRENPDDLAGWQRLIRSYAVLGRIADAEAAIVRASEAFEEDAPKKEVIEEFAATLGLTTGAIDQ
ncbi:c-type cytochrome biogenesis protein CcmI [Oricola cellulosilytica]|uniref:C-type cytochrome biogenesis protein CcmI n=1 Tax=Oricola cellulosilytica TaxID=1429082 RepID=A0A4R0PC80_9HYPH|nr:c-type cytochrome biogenesis protein CcmI [Oricola cellulosilytica]TCD14133.1 c-type cytochrome biogenesis protein CcmI [Oricola cellulosilytica]